MKKLWAGLVGLWSLVALFMPKIAAAAGGGAAAPVVIVADTRRLGGVLSWWANVYNESHMQFTLLTIVLIPLIGVIFGVIADFIMSHIVGIDLKSRELAEH